MPTATVEIAASLDDQTVERTGTAWPLTGANAYYTTPTVLHANKSFISPNYSCRNPLLRFDTSSKVPTNATITSASLSFYLPSSGTKNADGRSFSAGYYDWDGALATDWTDVEETSAIAAILLADFATTSGTKTFTLLNPDANIVKGGITELRCHITGGEPTGENHIQFASWDNTVQVAPYLTIEFTVENQETLRPNAALTLTNLSGAYTDIDEDPDAPDALWLVVP